MWTIRGKNNACVGEKVHPLHCTGEKHMALPDAGATMNGMVVLLVLPFTSCNSLLLFVTNPLTGAVSGTEGSSVVLDKEKVCS